MNNKLTIFSAGLAICGTITFVSCSQESNFLLDTNLDIDSQVPMTRSATEQIYEQPDYNQFSYGKDECCIVALVELKQQTMFEKTFTEDSPATMWYNDIKNYATSQTDENGKPIYAGGAMEHSLFLEVGKHFGLLSEEVKFGDDGTKDDIFTDPQKMPKIINIDVVDQETGEKKSHVARIISVNPGRHNVTYSVRNGEKVTTGTVDISDVKKAWR